MFPSRHKISYAVELIKYHLLLRGRYFALCQKKFLGRSVLSCGLFAWRPPRFVFLRKRRFAVFRRDGDVVYRLVLHRVVFRRFFSFFAHAACLLGVVYAAFAEQICLFYRLSVPDNQGIRLCLRCKTAGRIVLFGGSYICCFGVFIAANRSYLSIIGNFIILFL